MDASVLEEKSSFKKLGLTFLSKLDWGSYIISIGNLIHSMKIFFPEVALYLYKSTPIVTSGLVPLIASWNYYTSYKNEYARLSVLHLLLFSNPWLIVEMWPA